METQQQTEQLPEKSHRHENELLGHAITLRHIKEVRWKDGKEVLVDPPDQEFLGFPKKFREHHSSAINKIMVALDAFEQEKRDIPLSRLEAIEFLQIEKQTIKDLEKFGLIQTTNLTFRDKEKNKNLGPRQVILFTAQGLALNRIMKEALDDLSK